MNNTSTSLIYSKMSKVMSMIGSISKDQKNTAQGFKFRGIDQFINALYPALTSNGVFMVPRVINKTSDIREILKDGKTRLDNHVNLLIEYDFYAEDGSKVTIGPIAGEGIDSGDKATNKALSAALKYTLIQTFSIPTEDLVDGDSDSPTITSSNESQKANNVLTKSETSSTITQEEKRVVSGFRRKTEGASNV